MIENQTIENKSTTETDKDLEGKIAELSVLYEIANLSFEGSLKDFAEEAKKKARRLFAIYGFALLKGENEERTTVVSERFWDEGDIEEKIEENKDNQFIYHLGVDKDIGILFMEQKKKIDDSERRLYTIFGKQVEKGLTLAQNIRERQRAEEKNKIIERLDKIGAEIQSCDSKDELYSLAVEAAEDILDFDICGFAAVEEDVFVTRELSKGTPEDGHTERPVEEGGLDRKTYLNQESYKVNDLFADKDAKPVKNDYRSAISVPIGEHGVFQAVSKEIDYFDENDLNTAKLLISHVKEALDRIQAKEREKFLHSILRHDVDNKNQIIKGYLELMKDYDLSEKVKKFVKKSENTVKESSDMIEKVRTLREIEQKEEIGKVNMSSVLDKVLSEHQDQLEERCVKLNIEGCDFNVKGGPLLEELFSNLINNSIQHSDCDKIKMISQTEEDECVLTVEDDGVGIDDGMKDKIFERGFKDGENAGTGLGLYIIKEIAKSYGGSVEVNDSDMGGARFDIHLKNAKS